MNRSSLAICLTFLMFLLMVPKIDSGSKATRARPPLRRAKNILSEALLFGHLLSGKRRRYIAQQITHVGKCPAVNMTTSSDAECLDRCQYDIHCPYTKKCCGDGCGKKCVDIVGFGCPPTVVLSASGNGPKFYPRGLACVCIDRRLVCLEMKTNNSK